MSKPRQPKPKALRRPIIDPPELPADPWKAPWIRREPGPTQLAASEGRESRWRRRPSHTDGAEPPPNPPQAAPE